MFRPKALSLAGEENGTRRRELCFRGGGGGPTNDHVKSDDDRLGSGGGRGDISTEMSVGSVAAGGVPRNEWCCYHLLRSGQLSTLREGR